MKPMILFWWSFLIKRSLAIEVREFFPKVSIFMLPLISRQLQIENQENAVDFSLLFSLRRLLYGSRICWQAMQRGTEL